MTPAMDIAYLRHLGLQVTGATKPAFDESSCGHPGSVSSDKRAEAVTHSRCPAGVPAAKPLRLLCLHGSMQNGIIFRDRLKSLLKKMSGLADCDFLDGPYVLSSDSAGDRRCWWMSGDEPGKPHPEWASQWELSREVIRAQLLDPGGYDGVLGFSNGAAAVAMVLAEAGHGAFPKVRFGILCSGYRPDALRFIGPICGVPTLHICGDSDPYITADQSDDLLALFASPAPTHHLIHNAGHHVPSRTDDTKVVCDYLASQRQASQS